MSKNLITVNGKYDILNLSMEEIHVLNWRGLKGDQLKFRMQILDKKSIVFDSGLVEGQQPFCEFLIPYTNHRQQYVIQLEVTDLEYEITTYEKVIYSTNVSLDKASWITRLDNPIEKEWNYYKNKSNIIFEKEFHYEGNDRKVFLDICGLGYYIVKINNQRIDDTFLNNDVSNYSKIVYFDTYEIKRFLKVGENKISVELANGWYNPAPIKLLGKYNVRSRMAIGKPCLICQISYKDKKQNLVTINSDETWEAKEGRYLFDNLFIGERVLADSNLGGKSDDVMNQTMRISGPGGKLVPSQIPKIKRTQKFLPEKIVCLENKILIDFGRVIAGHFACEFSENIEGEIKIFYSEAVAENNKLDFRSSISGTYGYTLDDIGIDENDPAIQLDEITKGKEEFAFENKHVYHSFRYVEIQHDGITENDLKDVCGYRVHTELETASTFETSDEQLNFLWNVANDTKLNNVHSYFEDCPRERLGYGGDIVALIDSQIYSFDVEQLLMKVFKDFAFDQVEDGGIPQTAPYMGIQTHGSSNKSGSLGWQLAFPVIMKKLRQYYGRSNFFLKYVDQLKAHVNYLLAFDYEYIKHCCLGDWGSIDTTIIEQKETPPDKAFCSAIMYYLLLTSYAELFSSNEYQEVFRHINHKKEAVQSKIMVEFYKEEGYFQTGSQSSYAFALYSNIVTGEKREKVLDNFISKIKQDKGVLRSGIFGMSWTPRILSEVGRDDIVFSWLTRKEKPSFLNMLTNGSKILSEWFDTSMGSHNHAMFSSYTTWMIEKLLGVQVKEDATSANRVKISPYFPKSIEYAKGTIETIRGQIMIHWERKNDEIEMVLRFPIGIEFEIDKNFPVKRKEVKDEGFYRKLKLIASECVDIPKS